MLMPISSYQTWWMYIYYIGRVYTGRPTTQLTSSSDWSLSSSSDASFLLVAAKKLPWEVLGLIGSVKLAVDWSTPPFLSSGGEK